MIPRQHRVHPGDERSELFDVLPRELARSLLIGAFAGLISFIPYVGSIVGFGSYLTLIGRIGAHKAGYAVVMFPVVALLLSFLFVGLALTAIIVVGIGLVMAGIL